MTSSPHQKPQIFSDEDIQRFRADINATRVPGAYEPGSWSVSPLNRDPSVVGPLPATVRLRDVTLRALETLPGVVLDPARLRRFMENLVAAGVPEIVTAPIRGRSQDEVTEQIDTIKSLSPECRVTCPMIFTRDDLAKPAAAGYDSVQVWMPPWGEASVMYEGRAVLESWNGTDWRTLGLPETREGFLRRAVDLVSAARDSGLRVTVPVLMVSFLNEDRHAETVRALAEAGANEIALFDGPGAMGPEAMAELVKRTKDLVPDVEVGLHPHNSFGMAVAVGVSAVKAGADVVEVSVNGYCGGPGNADLAASVAAFEALYGISTGVRGEHLMDLARSAEEMTGYRRACNHPVTGEQVYNWGGMDFMTQELAVDELLHNCLAPGWAGAEPATLFTEGSGPFTAWDKLVALGFAPTRPAVDELLPLLKARMKSEGRLLEDQEIVELAQSAGLSTS